MVLYLAPCFKTGRRCSNGVCSLVMADKMGPGAASTSASDPLSGTRVRLLAFDLLSIQHHPRSPGIFLRKERPVRKVEVVGVVVTVARKESRLLFHLDDGTGCVPCVFWTNHHNSAYLSHLKEAERGLQAGIAVAQANQVQLGCLLRVQGKVSCFRSQLEVTISSVVNEKDPNAEVLQWMQCMQLALRCYDLPFTTTI